MKILIIDDELVSRKKLEKILGGLTECDIIDTAKSGADGLFQANAVPHPDIILLDGMMPDMDGFQVIQELKNNNHTKDIPVIFVTGLVTPDDEEKGLILGAVDYITKPFHSPIVKSRVRNHLRYIQQRKLVEASNKKAEVSMICAVERTKELNSKIKELEIARNELVQKENMASLGRLVAGFAHELNTPIGVAICSLSNIPEIANNICLQLSQDEVDDEELHRDLDDLKQNTKLGMSNIHKAADIITRFKRTSVDQSTETNRMVNIAELILDIISSLQSKFKRTKIEIKVNCPNDTTVFTQPGALGQVFTNLLINSWKHGFDQGKFSGRIQIDVSENSDMRQLSFHYRDSGKGMTQETREKVFSPFFTTTIGQDNSGLGMYICYNIIRNQLGGTITCSGEPDEGVLFQFNVPISQL